jgi:transcriptional regulator with XRE-family HTH domain
MPSGSSFSQVFGTSHLVHDCPMTRKAVSIFQRVREARGWSLRHVAELAGVSHEAVRQVEAGLHEPRPETVAAIATALGISDLLDTEATADRQPVAT